MRFAILAAAQALVLFCTGGCHSLQPKGGSETVSVEKAICLPANREPGVAQRSTGDVHYVAPECLPATPKVAAAAPPEVVDDAGDVVVEEEVDVTEIVPGPDTAIVTAALEDSACQKQIVAVSPDAVGDPCMTTEAFVDSLALTESQTRTVMAQIDKARGQVAGSVAH